MIPFRRGGGPDWLIRAIQVLIAVGVILVLAIILNGCGESHKVHAGKVISKRWEEPYDTTQWICTYRNKQGFCVSSFPQTTHHEAEFFLTLSECTEVEKKGCRHEEYHITEGLFNQIQQGDRWNDGSGKANES